MQQLVLGGVKSGKSLHAESLASTSGKQVYYVATATIEDEQMAQRIAKHQQQRPAEWPLIEEPLDLASVINRLNHPNNCLLIDCLTLWMTNLLLKGGQSVKQSVDELIQALAQSQADIILVSNETNMGITPMDALTRQFCDEIGLLHQQLGQSCQRVILMVAGIPSIIKG